MKNQKILVLCACLSLCSLFSAAQNQNFVLNEPNYNKPRAFDNLPAMVPISLDNLNDLVNSKPGVSTTTILSDDIKTAAFEGTVVSAVSKYDNKVQSVFIKSSNYNGATLYISKVTGDDGVTRYHGRMMTDFKHGDLYILQQKDGEFALVKKNYYDVINE